MDILIAFQNLKSDDDSWGMKHVLFYFVEFDDFKRCSPAVRLGSEYLRDKAIEKYQWALAHCLTLFLMISGNAHLVRGLKGMRPPKRFYYLIQVRISERHPCQWMDALRVRGCKTLWWTLLVGWRIVHYWFMCCRTTIISLILGSKVSRYAMVKFCPNSKLIFQRGSFILELLWMWDGCYACRSHKK